jgi:DNA helicase-2/ATP-dependent DNA helicase PcrA
MAPTDPENFKPAPPAPKPGGLAAKAIARPLTTPYLEQLNPEQRSAVEALDGPVLVLAGAGTGKTRVLTTRLAHLLNTQKAWPGQILSVTFTNKAAREMKERIGTLIGNMVEGMTWLGTFHSIGVKILRRHAELVGLRPDFTILDTDDQIRLLKQLISAEGIDEKRWPARQLATHIDGWKNRGLTPEKVSPGEAEIYADGRGTKLYEQYQARLKILNAVDFGDLLLESLRLFMENDQILDEYRKKFKYMLVDEYQDTNIVQYLWLRLLAKGTQNICCVGDDDQSIYGWRGAEIDNILRFEKDFPGAKVIRLEQNYRSTPHILAAASGLIAHNEGRLGKTLKTDLPDGDKVTLRGHWDGDEEARTIGEEIETLQIKKTNLDEVAILLRASFLMRSFEDRFMTLGLPYRVIGGPRFYERAEIRDAMAYLKITQSPDNDLAFERIINVPKRGIGTTSVKKMHEYARANGVSLYRAATSMCHNGDLTKRTAASLEKLLESFNRWRTKLETTEHTELAEIILDESGYTEMHQLSKDPKSDGRLDNLKELIRSMSDFENMTGFLEHVALVMDTTSQDAEQKVNLMTLHAAKGLEFDHVYLPAWEEGLFPHQRSLDESGHAGLEEERRLAYVGITRAKKRATISFAQNRRVHNLWQTSLPSRFIDELPEKNISTDDIQSDYGGYDKSVFGGSRFDNVTPFSNTYQTPGWQRARQRHESGQAMRNAPQIIEGEMAATETGATSFKIDQRVFHQKFGYGLITEISGNKLTIAFEKAGEKKVIDSFVEMT